MVSRVWGVLLLTVGATALAQGAPPPVASPTVTTEGTATVDSRPSYIEFWLHYRFTGATHAEAVQAAGQVEDRTTQAMEQGELSPMRLVYSAIAIPDVHEPGVHRTVRVQFGAEGLTDTEKARTFFAELCDKMKAAAAQLSCEIEGPVLGLENRVDLERSAVSRAIENAYVLAETAAALMQSSITGVDRIEIVSLDWNKDPDWRGPQPESTRLTCTAKVKLTYQVASRL